MTELEKGYVLGFFAREGHFGGDGAVPHILLRMHVDHLPALEVLCRLIPGSQIHGPYATNGRSYYQWRVRGRALTSLIGTGIFDQLKAFAAPSSERYQLMLSRYYPARGESTAQES